MKPKKESTYAKLIVVQQLRSINDNFYVNTLEETSTAANINGTVIENKYKPEFWQVFQGSSNIAFIIYGSSQRLKISGLTFNFNLTHDSINYFRDRNFYWKYDKENKENETFAIPKNMSCEHKYKVNEVESEIDFQMIDCYFDISGSVDHLVTLRVKPMLKSDLETATTKFLTVNKVGAIHTIDNFDYHSSQRTNGHILVLLKNMNPEEEKPTRRILEEEEPKKVEDIVIKKCPYILAVFKEGDENSYMIVDCNELGTRSKSNVPKYSMGEKGQGLIYIMRTADSKKPEKKEDPKPKPEARRILAVTESDAVDVIGVSNTEFTVLDESIDLDQIEIIATSQDGEDLASGQNFKDLANGVKKEEPKDKKKPFDWKWVIIGGGAAVAVILIVVIIVVMGKGKKGAKGDDYSPADGESFVSGVPNDSDSESDGSDEGSDSGSEEEEN